MGFFAASVLAMDVYLILNDAAEFLQQGDPAVETLADEKKERLRTGGTRPRGISACFVARWPCAGKEAMPSQGAQLLLPKEPASSQPQGDVPEPST